ncbi:ABC transporter substrate-binding protein [Polycladidibacter stylochi]|uniref:ABC transporter substrate-binding protein n=1 Tax=Polycladidibacter stylochi TaxID=1807766 RepID=UPI0008320422|nr:ABC transporter substrate-binding protein [Pseudovibrio stylochi]
MPTNSKGYYLSALLMLVIVFISSQSKAQESGSHAENLREDFLHHNLPWQQLLESAQKEQQVNFYYWGGSIPINLWIDQNVTNDLKALGIKLNARRLSTTKEAIDLIVAEMAAGRSYGQGSIDLLWVNGENFYTLKKQNALWGPFADKLPNSKNYDWLSDSITAHLNLYDFGTATNMQELPWSGEQFICAADRQYLPESKTPHTFAELKEYLINSPGKFTYVKPPHYLGNTFVQSVIYAKNPTGTGAIPFQKPITSYTPKQFADLIKPAFTYLQEIEPFLLQASKGNPHYPGTEAALDQLFQNGEVHINCKFGIYAVHNGFITGQYPEKARIFVFPKGLMIKNKSYLVIPKTAPHPASALVAANYFASIAAQSKMVAKAAMPNGIDLAMLNTNEREILQQAAPPLHGLTHEQLSENAAPDMNASLVNIIKTVWLEKIEKKSSETIESVVEKYYKSNNINTITNK